MPDTIKNPISEVFNRWSKAVEPVVGKNNYSMDKSQTIASTKKAYARLLMLGNTTRNSDLEGDECATLISFQTESYASGANDLSKVYDEIDEASHKAMVGMGFRRIYGPELQNNAENSIKRVVSRYSRTYTGQFL